PRVVAERIAAHRLAVNGEVRSWDYERPVLEERPLGQEPVELAHFVGAEPAPEHELLGARDRIRRVDLQAAEPFDRVQDRARARRGELLAHDRQAPGLRKRQLERHLTHFLHHVPLYGVTTAALPPISRPRWTASKNTLRTRTRSRS